MQPLEELLGHLAGRISVVVGKGGVGKTTTAGALGLALAERAGARVHVLSTDPAHSLGDLFGQDLSTGAVAASGCAPGVALEELDVAGRGRAWLEQASPRLAELVERGTYLDGDDVLGMLGPSLPGMDEIVAAFRLVELSAEADLRRIVVDAAPTGHLLRLLEADRVLEGWVQALDAMAEKASAVAGQLAGRHVRSSGEDLLDELRYVVRTFREDVLPAADFVVVTTGHPVVAAETDRLLAELARRELRVAALVEGAPDERAARDEGAARDDGATRDEGARASDEGGQAPDEGAGAPARRPGIPVVRVRWASEPSGCEGLRRWGTPAADGAAAARGSGARPAAALGSGAPSAQPAAARGAGRPSARPAAARGPGAALERPLLLFAGKGGVGKSTCAAAWAVRQPARSDALLLGADPAGSLFDVLGLPDDPGRSVPGVPGLEVRQIAAEERFERLKQDYHARIEEVFRRFGLDRSNRLDRRVMGSLVQLAPSGLDEIFALDALLDALEERREVVLDGAPTGHFLRLMEMPEQALAWTRGLLRALLRYRSALGLDDVAERVLRLSRSVRALSERLSDPTCTGIVVVTVPGALPVAETRHLLERLRGAGLPVAAVVHNRYSLGSAPDEVGVPDGAARVLAPRLEEPPVGVDALRSFVSQWEWR